MPKKNFYGVSEGKQGPAVYSSWWALKFERNYFFNVSNKTLIKGNVLSSASPGAKIWHHLQLGMCNTAPREMACLFATYMWHNIHFFFFYRKDCKTNTDGHSGATFKGFATYSEAERFAREGGQQGGGGPSGFNSSFGNSGVSINSRVIHVERKSKGACPENIIYENKNFDFTLHWFLYAKCPYVIHVILEN